MGESSKMSCAFTLQIFQGYTTLHIVVWSVVPAPSALSVENKVSWGGERKKRVVVLQLHTVAVPRGTHARSVRCGAPVAERARQVNVDYIARARTLDHKHKAAGRHALPRRARAGARSPHPPGAD